MLTRALALALVALVGGCEPFFECPATRSSDYRGLETALSQTGLFADISTEEVDDGVESYRPQFQLWSDGADKRRWIRLPTGSQIDTSDMDAWQFPVGTRVWKEFSRDGVRVETRLIERTGAQLDAWSASSYLWRDDQSDADLQPLGAIDARGTAHDVPAAGECVACHGGRSSYVLGFSAVQLAYQSDEFLTLEDLVDRNLLSAPPAAVPQVPGNETERQALGYLHANCGHCHNRERPGGDASPCYDPRNILDFWLRVDALDSPEVTPAYQTAIGSKVVPGEPDQSVLIDRVSRRTYIYKMPPLGSDDVDDDAVALLRRWVEGLE
ncbi:MAG: hypothetical protein KJO07_04445 [Deltaproteobacteria bacterium]|jgi:hypothetical protein|nr:hypothetical protein [Deltaproteobacteria bacterium]